MHIRSEARQGASGEDLAPEDALLAVEEALRRIQYGSILITIHQGEVVTIETSTKVRLKRRE